MSLDRVRRSCCWVMGLAWPALAAAATWDTRLSVPVSAGHSDNTRLVTDARKESDTFWRIAPGISLSAQAPRWRASVNYAYLLERHLRGDRDGHRSIREPDAPFNGAITAIGIQPMDRKPLRPFLSTFPLAR